VEISQWVDGRALWPGLRGRCREESDPGTVEMRLWLAAIFSAGNRPWSEKWLLTNRGLAVAPWEWLVRILSLWLAFIFQKVNSVGLSPPDTVPPGDGEQCRQETCYAVTGSAFRPFVGVVGAVGVLGLAPAAIFKRWKRADETGEIGVKDE